MRVAIVQMRCEPGQIQANCDRARKFAEQAKSAGCSVIVYPEMFDTGYEMATIKRTASPWPGAPLDSLTSAARELGLYVIAGLSERVESSIYNAVAAIDPQGALVGHYRKVHLFSLAPVSEHQHLAPGDALCVTKINDVPFGIMVCYDLRFPELARALALSGAEVLVTPSAFPLARRSHWEVLTSSRAIENQCYVLAANRCGTDAGLTFAGHSRVIDPRGEVLAAAGESDEELLIADLNRDLIAQTRAEMTVFADRRPDVYRKADSSGER